jgi:hypothetical protein
MQGAPAGQMRFVRFAIIDLDRLGDVELDLM